MPDTQIIVTPMATIKEWYQEGDQPSQEQFWATFDSLYHKHEGAIVRHPTEAEVTVGNKTFEILTISGPIKIPASGNYPGSMEDLSKAIRVVPFGAYTIYKGAGNEDLETIESGDIRVGLWNGLFAIVQYNVGNTELYESYSEGINLGFESGELPT